jgi:hypothetical protein
LTLALAHQISLQHPNADVLGYAQIETAPGQ